MNYTTPAEIIEKYSHAQKFLIQLTNLDGGTTINETVLQKALDDASEEM
ncbi:MAG: phage protein Gp36 family protein [Spirulina sp.]